MKPPLVYCSIRHSGLAVTTLAAEELGLRFTTLPADLPKARLVLGLHEHDMRDVWVSLRKEAYIGRLFGADSATDKATSEELASLVRALAPANIPACIPETWLLPRDASSLRATMAEQPGAVFILKPRNSSEGNGIRLLLSFDDVGDLGKDVVIQRYIATPLLLGGLKFDLRMYVLVKRLEPLETWICHEGLARFCTEEYQAPTQKNKHKVTSHLTNYSLNKRTEHFVHSDDPHGGDGSKRSLSSVLPMILASLGVDEDELWSRLSKATLRGMIPLVPFLLDAERQQRQAQRSNGFDGPHFAQLFGVDLILDEQGAAWLLEMNSFPSLSFDSTVPFLGEGKCCRCMDDYKPHVHVQSAVDHHVKRIVVRGTIQLLLGRPLDTRGGASGSAGSETGEPHGGANEDNGPPPQLQGNTMFTRLVPEGTDDLALKTLSRLVKAFGVCCKAGAATADAFRLRRLFVGMGEDAQDVDLQLRRLAHSEGLSFVPVANFLFERLRARVPDEPLLDVLLGALPVAEGAEF